MTAKEFLSLPRQERGHVRLIPRRRGPQRPRELRKTWQDEKALRAFLLENNIRSAHQLAKWRKKHRHAPTTDDFKRVFGSWSQAKRSVFGEPCFQFNQNYTPMSVLRAIVEMKLWSIRQYQKARMTDVGHDVLPTISYIRREFGCWSNAIFLARQMSKEGLEQWFTQAKKLGRPLSAFEMQTHGIDLSRMQEVYHSRRELNDFLRSILKTAFKRETMKDIATSFIQSQDAQDPGGVDKTQSRTGLTHNEQGFDDKPVVQDPHEIHAPQSDSRTDSSNEYSGEPFLPPQS